MKNIIKDTLLFAEGGQRIPKHEALCKALVMAIERGVWKVGEKLPTEQELAKTYPFSLGTIQRAVRSLVERGLVRRRRGAGTFVVDRQRLLENPLYCRFCGKDGFLPVYSKLLSRKLLASMGPWSKPLKQTGRSVLRIDREISVGGEFKVLSRFYVDLHRFPSLLTREAEDLAASNIKMLIAREYQVLVTRVEQVVSVGVLPNFACHVLGVGGGSQGMHIELLGMEDSGRAVAYQELYVPPNPYRIVVSQDFNPDEWSEDGSVAESTSTENLLTKGDSHEIF